MQKLITLVGLNTVAKAQLMRDLSAHFQEQGLTTQQFDGSVTRFADTNIQTSVKSDDQITIWNTPQNTEMERLSSVLLDQEAQGVQPLTIALLDTRTCDCFPTLREEMEQTADLTLSLPFDLKEALWKVSEQL
jgi:hypothetical protein